MSVRWLSAVIVTCLQQGAGTYGPGYNYSTTLEENFSWNKKRNTVQIKKKFKKKSTNNKMNIGPKTLIAKQQFYKQYC